MEQELDISDLKAFQEELEFYNKEMARLMGVQLATLKSWNHRQKLPRYIQYHLDALIRIHRNNGREWQRLLNCRHV